ncbi:aldo/keto reductase [Flavobacterium sp. Sd200]|uniref:aldo/keto reductase n=1 Tax=Flavobacterium sp. Sd200 TaxID=2692211 RepID=UPI00136CFD2C|nr:aldo/keto reductase [Flavobacterium sp. Sd200]MXN90309.1 aldo/keto reductase [Flavobacterium sp. Sd200]
MENKLFGSNTGIYASELILGTANFGMRSGYGTNEEDAIAILSAYTDTGGNFLDTSDRYQLGQSEEIIGKFIGNRRNDYIICTKYTQSSNAVPAISNYGNHRKAMRQAIEASLKRLNTDYIDIYMPHFDDGVTPLDEIARGLEDLVKSGKILYTGLTNFPSWKAAAISSKIKLHAIQAEYSLIQRTTEREILPMAHEFGLGTMMYSPLGGGVLTAKYRSGETGRLNRISEVDYKEDSTTKNIIDELLVIAKELDSTPTEIALAWVISKRAFPMIGARSIHHFKEVLNATLLKLSPDHISRLDMISAVSLGYPHDLLNKVRGNN